MDEPLNNQQMDPVKTSEGANMALNRLVAEDFLESLGKELGLEVPAEKQAAMRTGRETLLIFLIRSPTDHLVKYYNYIERQKLVGAMFYLN